MFSSLRDRWQRRTQRRDRTLYETGLRAIAPTPEGSHLTEHLALWDHWSDALTFHHYRAADAEGVVYHGDYARASSLLEALQAVHGVLYRGEAIVLKDELHQPMDREYSLDYFLTDHSNRILAPGPVFREIHRLLSECDRILIDLEESEDPEQARLAPFYRLKYDTYFKAGLVALSALVRVSDLYND